MEYIYLDTYGTFIYKNISEGNNRYIDMPDALCD
jgi:hypothetical protein